MSIADPSSRAEARRPPPRSNWFVELLKTWGPPILAVLFIRAFIFEPFRIPSGSMVPTLQVGDFVAVSKFSYGVWLPFARKEIIDLGDPERGDIIVFRYPRNESLNYIKRVVGIPGDRISVRNNQIVLNGEVQGWEPAEDSYPFTNQFCSTVLQRRNIENLDGLRHDLLVGSSPGGLANRPEITVPPNSVFVMGDNRDNSADSRDWGFVRYDQIKGKAYVTVLSLDPCSSWLPRGGRFFQGLYNEPSTATAE